MKHGVRDIRLRVVLEQVNRFNMHILALVYIRGADALKNTPGVVFTCQE